jgi:hypothetical protein
LATGTGTHSAKSAHSLTSTAAAAAAAATDGRDQAPATATASATACATQPSATDTPRAKAIQATVSAKPFPGCSPATLMLAKANTDRATAKATPVHIDGGTGPKMKTRRSENQHTACLPIKCRRPQPGPIAQNHRLKMRHTNHLIATTIGGVQGLGERVF